MKKRFFFLIGISSVVVLFAQNRTNQDIDTLIKYDLVESIDKGFLMIPFSEKFISKFHLSEKEIELIGDWLRNDFIPNNKFSTTTYANILSFLPNRILKMNIYYSDNQGNQRKCMLFCKWKIEDNYVKIQLLYILYLDTIDFKTVVVNQCKMEGNDYKVIGTVENYEKAYVQKTSFFWNNLELEKINSCLILVSDILRYRWLFEPAMPNIFQRIGTNEIIRDFLLNPQYDDPEYLFQLYTGY